MSPNRITFSVTEEIGVSITNYAKGFLTGDGPARVQESKARYIMRAGGCLDVVPLDYVPQEFEYFVTLTRRTSGV